MRTAGLDTTTSPGNLIVMVTVTLLGTTVLEQPSPPPPWLHQSRSVSGPACWLSVLLQSVPRCRRVLRHTDTHPHLPDHIHPGGPPPWVCVWFWFLSVSVWVVGYDPHHLTSKHREQKRLHAQLTRHVHTNDYRSTFKVWGHL